MNDRFNVLTLSVGLALVAFAGTAGAQSDLTPIGATRAGNKEGTIPAWEGVDQPLPGWSYGKVRGDFWKYKDEKPILVIDASNVDKYADNLTAGQINMLKTFKGYTMPVYPSHRNCGFPDQVVNNTKAEGGKAKIAADGWSLENAILPGVPFPAPKSGIEAIWNHLIHYSGLAADYPAGFTYVSPAPGSDKGIRVGWNQLLVYPWGDKEGAHDTKSNAGLEVGVYYTYNTPAALAGQAIVQRYYFGADTETFYYFPGQRRVRRLPAYAYDAPLIGFENQYPADMSFIFIGNPDRFDWKLVGKKEIYVPYNNFKTANFKANWDDMAKPGFVSADFRRYELHRVYEVIGTVKAGVRHSAPKKTVYLDEDTWNAVVGDDYDAQGKLWKSKETGVRPFWEVNSCNSAVQWNFYDFSSGRYVVDNTVVGTGKDLRVFSDSSQDPRLKPSYFTAETLRANSER